MRFTDRTVLITGAGRGIGAACARAFAGEAARVIVNYRASADAAARLVADIESAGGRAEAVCADVRDGAAVKAMVADVARRHGGIDILVNNAGAASSAATRPTRGTAVTTCRFSRAGRA